MPGFGRETELEASDAEKQQLFDWGDDIFGASNLNLRWRPKDAHFVLYVVRVSELNGWGWSDMKRIIIVQLMVLLASSIVAAQTRSDVCHVYVVDVAKTTKAVESVRESGDDEAYAEALAIGQTVFPEFRPLIGEEELTTKTYRFPRSSLIITASVYYTDESMRSVAGADSMLVGIVTSPRAQTDALSTENNAVSEVTDSDNLDTVRAKKYVRVNGRLSLVGIECRCKERPAPN